MALLLFQQPDVIPEVGNSVTLASENGDEIYHKDEIPVSATPHSNLPSDTPPTLPCLPRDRSPQSNPDLLGLVTRLSDVGQDNKDGRPEAANDTPPTLIRSPPPYPYPAPLNPVMMASEKQQDANNNRKTPLLNLLVSLTFKMNLGKLIGYFNLCACLILNPEFCSVGTLNQELQ